MEIKRLKKEIEEGKRRRASFLARNGRRMVSSSSFASGEFVSEHGDASEMHLNDS